ncbi:unnamed protein product [Cylicocyclus nassatus]|uniref:Methyltransferase type 11 domain-containing protein n=1 Tax=Cylicocyclus nassatus TaxID=53992 RepID=A0AA36H5Q8_CYLNA|nr:unnamed protein product [Cylicocyclus nassatus]
MRYISPVLGIQFMNLGYWPTEDSAEDDAEMMQIVKRNSTQTDPDRPHYYLYERALMAHPDYPTLDNLQLIEVGCGQGNGIKWIKRAHPHIRALKGIDRCAIKETCMITGDAHNLPFDDHQFDIVLNVESSHLYHDCEQFFRECARVLKKGGYLCWIDLRYQSQAKNEQIQVHSTRQQAMRAGLVEERWDDVTKNVLEGIERTASRYDRMLEKEPTPMRDSPIMRKDILLLCGGINDLTSDVSASPALPLLNYEKKVWRKIS